MSATNNPGDARVAATGTRLHELLEEVPQYRLRWERQALQHRGGAVHQGAVAMVLAEYLWDSGQAAETDQALPRRLKDVVSRALGGRVLSARTLLLFVDAFEMSPEHAAQLHALRSGRAPAAAAAGPPFEADPTRPAPGAGGQDASGPDVPGAAVRAAGTATSRPTEHWRAGVTDRRFHTVALHELHTLGPDGIPIEHRTMHVIRAEAEVARYRYLFDTDAVEVRVLRGGQAGPVYPVGEMFAVDIEFARPLLPGETGSFEYVTYFAYRTPPDPLFRRGAHGRIENVELHVRFHPLRLPERIWWAIWPDQLGDEPTVEELVRLEPDASVHRFLDEIEACSVGFHWQFPVQS